MELNLLGCEKPTGTLGMLVGCTALATLDLVDCDKIEGSDLRFAICLNPSKDSRPRRTPGTACACPPSRASASGHLSVSPWIKFYLGPPGAILGLFSIRRVDFSLKLIIIGFFLINKITISKVFDNKKAKIKINRNHLYHYRGLTDC